GPEGRVAPVRLGEAAMAAEGQGAEDRPGAADGREAQIRRAAPRPAPALPADRRLRPGGAQAGLRALRTVVRAGGRPAHAADRRRRWGQGPQGLPGVSEGACGPPFSALALGGARSARAPRTAGARAPR